MDILSQQDHGWAWMVLVGSAVINSLFFFFYRVYTLLYMVMLQRFGESDSTTAVVMTIHMACASFLAPCCSSAANTFGLRKVAIAGGILSAVGYFASAFANSIYFIYATIGVIAGAGCCAAVTTSHAALIMYFNKKRGTAVSVSTLFGAIAPAVFIPIAAKMLETYSFPGTMMIIGGMFFNVCAAGALYRPMDLSSPSLQAEVANVNEKSSNIERDDKNIDSGLEMKCFPQETTTLLDPPAVSLKQSDINVNENSDDGNESVGEETKDRHELIYEDKGKIHAENTDSCLERKTSTKAKPLSSNSGENSEEHVLPSGGGKIKSFEDEHNDIIEYDESSRLNTENIMLEQIFSPAGCGQGKSDEETKLKEDKHEETVNSQSSQDSKSKSKKKINNFLCKDPFVNMCDPDLLKSPTFLLLCINACIMSFGMILTSLFLSGFATEKGFSLPEQTVLLVVLNAVEGLGRFACGFFFDVPFVRRHCPAAWSLIKLITSVITIVIVFVEGKVGVYILLILCQTGYGILHVQRSTVLGHVVEIRKMTTAVGILKFISGFGLMLASYFGGYLKDITGKYQWGFLLAGAIGVLPSIGFLVQQQILLYTKNPG